jgi:hypothetical protein
MERFEVLANEIAIGYTDLEAGDPPMGVASGLLTTTPEYVSIQPLVLKSNGQLVEGLNLSVRVRGGQPIPSSGGVVLEDYSADLGVNISAVEVTVLGIPYSNSGW